MTATGRLGNLPHEVVVQASRLPGAGETPAPQIRTAPHGELTHSGAVCYKNLKTLFSRQAPRPKEMAVKKILMLLAVIGAQFVPAMNLFSTDSPLASVAEAGRRQTILTHTNVNRDGTGRGQSYAAGGSVPRRVTLLSQFYGSTPAALKQLV